MKKLTLLLIGILLSTSLSFAQKDIKIASVDVDVQLINDGEGRYYCIDSESKKPIEGKLRIVQGVQSQYIDAEFKEGYAIGTWKSFSNNKQAAEGSYKDGFPDGDFKEFYTDGKLASVKRYTKGKLDGKCLSYFADDKLESESEFKNGEPEGKWVTYHQNGKKESEKEFKTGKEDGVDRKYDEDGKLRLDNVYKDGKLIGKSIQHFYSNGGDHVRTANYNDGVLEGDYSEIFEDGAIKAKGNYSDGKKQGRWEYGRSDGRKLPTEEYDEDKIVRKITYYTNGKPEIDREMKDGKDHGVLKKYDFNTGNLKSEERYRNGKEDGLQIKYMHSNIANYTIKSNYINSRLDGVYIEEYDGGAIKIKGNYVKGNKHGEWVYNDMELTDKGKLKSKKERKEKYDNGKLISK